MKLLVSALEPSANLHLEPLLKNIKTSEVYGIFDERFEAFGKPLVSSGAFSAMGFLDVIPKIFKAKSAIKVMARMSLFVDKVLLIDAPAFNIPLAKAIRAINPNIEIIYYILPKAWAWKPKRVALVEKYCSTLCSIFPFESVVYNKATYVGNPLLDEIPVFRLRHEQTGVVAFLPGSRKSEIKSLFPIYAEVASKIENKEKLLVIPPHFSDEEICNLYGDISGFRVCRNPYEAFLQSEFAFVCSGTATLEAALIGVPFVLAYKAKALDFWIAKKFVKLKYVGLANILLAFEGEDILHKELLQEMVNVESLLNEYNAMDAELFLSRAVKLRKILQNGSIENMCSILEGEKSE